MDKSISIFKDIEQEQLFLKFFIKKIKEEYKKNDLFFCLGSTKSGLLRFEEVIDPDLCLSLFVVNFLKFYQELLSSPEGAFLEFNLYNYPVVDVSATKEVMLSSILKDESLMQNWFNSLISRLAFEKSLDFLANDLELINIEADKGKLTKENRVFFDISFDDQEINELFNGVCSIFLEVNKKYNMTKGFTYNEIKSGLLKSFLSYASDEVENGLKLSFHNHINGSFFVSVELFTNAVKNRVMQLIRDCGWVDYCIDFANICGMDIIVKDAKDTFEVICKNNVVLIGKEGQNLDNLDLFNQLSEKMSNSIEDALVGKIANNLSTNKNNGNNCMNFYDGYICNWEGHEIVFPSCLEENSAAGDEVLNFTINEFVNKNPELLDLKNNIKSLMGLMVLTFLKNKNLEETSSKSDNSVIPIRDYGWSVFSDYWINDVGFSDEKDRLKSIMAKISSLEMIYKSKRIDPVNIYKVLILSEYLKKETKSGGDIFVFDINAIKKRSMRAMEQAAVEYYVIIALEEGLWRTTIEIINFEKMNALKDTFPNFKDVLDYYVGAFKIYLKNGFLPSPVLLIGEPGLGKTEFSHKLSECINVHFSPLQMSSLTAGWIIGGSSSQWKDAKPGLVSSVLLTEEMASSLIMLDEIDKVNSGKQYDPLGSLYPLLESSTAKSFSDEFLDLPMDASHLIWIATANHLNNIPEPILDRFVVFEIKQISKEESKAIVKSIFSDLTKNLDVELLGDDVMNYLSAKTPRDIKRILKRAIATAANRKDLIEIHKKDIQEVEKSGMGFN